MVKKFYIILSLLFVFSSIDAASGANKPSYTYEQKNNEALAALREYNTLLSLRHLKNDDPKKKNYCSRMEDNFVTLWDLYPKLERGSSIKKQVDEAIDYLDDVYNEWIKNHRVPFLDKVYSYKEHFYRVRAKYEDARGLRQYGELLLERGKHAEGWKYLEAAVAKSEPRALFLVAERYAKGLGQVEQDSKKAVKLMKRSAELGYAPACEMLAKIYWDRSWGQNRNSQLAITYLEKAIRLFKKWKLDDKNNQKKFLKITDRLDWILDCMNFFKTNPLKNDGIKPSYDAMLIGWYDPNFEGSLRAMMYYILNEMETWRGDYALQRLGSIDLSKVEIKIADCGKYVGLCTHWAQNDTYSFRIQIDSSAYRNPPTAKDRGEQWWRKTFKRQMHIVNTLAHELAHGYFASRYPKISDFGKTDQKLTYEGHATTVAYQLINEFYYDGALERNKYANTFLSDNYKRYFNWFNHPESKCLTPSGRLINGSFDSWEEAASGNKQRVKTRTLTPRDNKTYAKPQYFGRAFYGYM